MLENFAIVLITGEVTVRNYSSVPTNICMTQGMTFPTDHKNWFYQVLI